MPTFDTSARRIKARLLAEGWIDVGGTRHDKFEHPAHPGVLIVVPRHKEQSPGVARSIARLAGWI